MEPLAKPTGILLKVHTRNVRDEGQYIVSARPFLVYKYAMRTGKNLIALVDACARWHDEGKRHPDWQDPCRLDFAAYQRYGGKSFKAVHLQKGMVRHEFDSLVRMQNSAEAAKLPNSAYAAVAAHHSKLGHRHAHRWKASEPFKRIWLDEMVPLSAELDANDVNGFRDAIARRYEYSGLRAVLRLADRRASAKEEKVAVPDLQRFKYDFPHEEKRGVQRIIPQLWDEPFAMLRAPTGAGKTDAALLWAQHQIEAGRADRLVWAMPTRFTANALAIATTETLGHTGLYHSSAWYHAKQKEQRSKVPTIVGWKLELDYARTLETPATVTTIDQLCMCLTAAREDHHATFWNLAHSCVVIDEADFYDDFTQQNLVVLLRALKQLEVPVLLMSATLPEISLKLYAQSGFQPRKIFEANDEHNENRIRLNIQRAGGVEFPEDIEQLLQRGLAGEALIIYANTVARAQAYLDWFAQRKFRDVVLYHSRFTEPDKEQIEQSLLKMLGPDAWKSKTPSGVAILTQIGELSVNISTDLMISDVCPTDRLAQRAGRLCRFEKRADGTQEVVGELHLIEPQKTNKQGERYFYPAPYGYYDRGQGWQITEILRTSNEQLQNGSYSAHRFVELVNDLYNKLPELSTRTVNNTDELTKAAVRNWLINPTGEPDDDDDETGEWRSRDIPQQKIVYANTNFSAIEGEGDPLYFPSEFAFREWALERAVTIAVFDYQRARKDGKILPQIVIVGNDEQTIWTVVSRYYSKEYGLRFDIAPGEDDY